MARKVLISFLGVSNYIDCIYTFDGKESGVVFYVQNSIVELLASDFDKFFIFCTEKAYETHFQKLQKESKKKLEAVKIPQGLNEDEIWQIFEIVYEKLNDGDEVIYDITHSFRSLPMLGITLLQYSKFLKNIKVLGIYYGAFENLGSPKDIQKRYPLPNQRKVPILNLTPFSLLQDWTSAANNFITLGNAKMIRDLTNQSLTPILSKSKGKDKDASILRSLSIQLENFSKEHRTNRGKIILEAKSAIKAKGIIDEIENYSLIPPFKPIVNHIKSTLGNYSENSVENLLRGVEWCIDKQLVQEGLTQLQEGIVTILCEKINVRIDAVKLRELISSYLTVRFRLESEKWSGELGKIENLQFVEQLDKIDYIEEIARCYDAITKKRNDINHGGFVYNTSYEDFSKSLVENYNKVKKYFN